LIVYVQPSVLTHDGGWRERRDVAGNGIEFTFIESYSL